MALYMYQAAYTAESVAAQINEPQDRIKVVTPALEALPRHRGVPTMRFCR